ncbi:CHAT domain-containing protein [Suillus cothurnatus]|nr:CHAT domain-containing protein [Suillus cothurnatus]
MSFTFPENDFDPNGNFIASGGPEYFMGMLNENEGLINTLQPWDDIDLDDPSLYMMLLMSDDQTKYHTARKIHLTNALIHAKAKEMNSDQPIGSRYTLGELREMVAEDPQMKNLTRDEKTTYVSALREHREQKLDNLRVRTGTYATVYVVRATSMTQFKAQCMVLIIPKISGRTSMTLQWPMFSVNMSNGHARRIKYLRDLNERDSLETVRKQARKLIVRGLVAVTGKKDITMNYNNYNTAIIETYAVKLVGWPQGVKFISPSNIGTVGEIRKLRDALKARTCYWAALTPAEVKLHTAELDACRSAGQVVWQPCKKRSDAGVAHMRKAPPTTGQAHKENRRLSKKVKKNSSAQHREAPKNNLGGALATRFKKRGDIDDITRAISLRREALTLCPPGHPRRDTILNNLALALITRYDKSYVSEDLNEAIDRYRESHLLTRLDDPERHVTLYSLSSALCSRFMHTRKNGDVEEAIRLCQEALASLPSLHPDRCRSHAWLQRAYLSRYCIQHNPTDLSSAMEHFRLSSIHPTEGFPERIRVAIDWARQAEIYQHESALKAYQVCFELFDSHVMSRSSIFSRREAATAFHGAQSLPVDAASCATRRENLRQAVELLEQGRGQQWSLASRLRTPLEDLWSANPQLAQRLSELSKHLSHAQGSTGSTDPAAADRAATEYRRLTGRWKAAVAEIRNLRAFSRFLLPPSYEDLQAAARQGPVIILIASQYSCSAIIVPTSGDPHNVPLPSVSLTELNNLKDRFARAIRHASVMGPKVPRNDLIVLLRTVWNEIMLPIVNVLENVLKINHRSRIWLCPTAAFTSIPLHAAHPFQTNADGSKEPCLEDLYICSYAPTLSALVRSRQMMKKRVTPSFATIGQGQPGAGKGKALLAVDSELELVHKFVPATAKRTTISGDTATRVGALQALEENTWVHLACHGKQDPAQPYDSHFVMRDEHLTLLDIMEKDIPRAEFAFLSACHTAVGDEKTPDEVIHLAAGLQFSGFKSVIGTLWEVNDAVAKHVVEAFYKYMFMDLKDGKGVVMDCSRAAWALNCATHAVKTKVPLEQRMVFIHIGV